jgi:hypothetical protein|tara:strand:- start:708 stop:839 length:132 start_codon:yes stop_codon:yes gene_type:complete
MLGLGAGLQKASNTIATVINKLRELWNTNNNNWQEDNNNWESL